MPEAMPEEVSGGPAQSQHGETRRCLRRLIELSERSNELTLGELVDALDHTGRPLLMVSLTLPSLIPFLPNVFAFALVLVAFQAARERSHLSLPSWLRRRRLPRATTAALAKQLDICMAYIGRWLQPRFNAVVEGWAGMLPAASILAMSLLLLAPIPFGNQLAAIAIIVITFGMMERDGAIVLVGLVIAAAALAWNVVLLLVGAQLVQHLWS
jgi:hypothetical protein